MWKRVQWRLCHDGVSVPATTQVQSRSHVMLCCVHVVVFTLVDWMVFARSRRQPRPAPPNDLFALTSSTLAPQCSPTHSPSLSFTRSNQHSPTLHVIALYRAHCCIRLLPSASPSPSLTANTSHTPPSAPHSSTTAVTSRIPRPRTHRHLQTPPTTAQRSTARVSTVIPAHRYTPTSEPQPSTQPGASQPTTRPPTRVPSASTETHTTTTTSTHPH